MNIYRRAGITDLYRMKEMYDASSPSFPDGGNQMRIGNPYGNLYEEGGQEEEKKGKLKLAKLVLAVDKYDPVTGTHYTVDGNGNVTPYQLPKSKGEVIGNMKESEMWNSQTGYLKIPLYGFQSGQDNTFNKYFKGFPYSAPYVYGDRTVAGIEDVTDWVRDGYYMFYNKEDATAGGWKYYKDADGHIIRINDWSNINDAGLTPIEYSEVRKMLPKREYIGGKDYRFKTMQRIPGFVDYVTKRANAYGVDPNLILHRIGKEGWIDQIVQQYNSLNTNQQNDSFWSGLWDLPVGGFGSFGLDDAGSNLMSGKYTLLDPNATWEETEAMNEKGRIVHSILTENLKSALEIEAAEMAYRQREAAKKYGKSGRDLNIWTNAAFNMGLNHPKLADDDYIRRNYSYPDYLGASLQKKFGGILHAFDGGKDIQYYAKGGNICIKPENRGKFTALKKRTGHSASWFKENGTPAQKKMAVFALNARKWKHGDGGLIERYGPDAVRSALQTVKANRFGDGGDTEEEYYDVLPASVVTASLPVKFHGSQEAARRYAEGYKFGKRVAQGRDEFANEWVAPAVIGLSAGPAGAIAGLAGRMVDVGVNALTKGDKNTWGDLFVSPQKHPWWNLVANFTNPGYLVAGPLSKGLQNDLTSLGREAVGLPAETVKATADVPVASELQKPQVVQALAPQASYEIADLGGGYMLKSLMRGNPLEKQISKQGTVSVNNIKALMNKGSKVEQAVVDKVLSSEEFAGKKAVDYNKFRKAVQGELITYERVPNEAYAEYGMDRIGQKPQLSQWSSDWATANNFIVAHPELDYAVDDAGNIFAAREVPGLGKIYDEPVPWEEISQRYPGWKQKYAMRSATPETFTFESPRIPNGSGRHYGPNTLGHSRTYTTADEPDVLHVMESQSDWAQQSKRGNIAKDAEKASLEYKKDIDRANALFEENVDIEKKLAMGIRPDGTNIEHDYEYRDIREIIERNEQTRNTLLARAKKYDMAAHPDKYVQESYLQDNYTSRQIQENLRYAAEKGQKKMRYPTRETAAKIEGYSRATEPSLRELSDAAVISLRGEKPTPYTQELFDLREKLDVGLKNDILPKNKIQKYENQIRKLEKLEALWREGKATYSTKLETILDKYSAFPNQYQKLFKGADVRTVADAKGNTWYEVDVPKDYLKQEWVYNDGGALNNPLIGIGIFMD